MAKDKATETFEKTAFKPVIPRENLRAFLEEAEAGVIPLDIGFRNPRLLEPYFPGAVDEEFKAAGKLLAGIKQKVD